MPSRMCLFVQRGGRVRFFWGSNGSMSSHSLSVKLLEYGIDWTTAFLFDLSLSSEIPHGFYINEPQKLREHRVKRRELPICFTSNNKE